MSVSFVSLPVTRSPRQGSINNRNTVPTKNNSFNHVFEQASDAIQNLDNELAASGIDLVMGNARDMHTAVLAAEKASLTLDLIVSVRNKAIEAYQEIMRMPL